eukprot:TRINITY_DN81826_c0_g1_i1.p1 TRINITY_DN81826_c0_g1~~TRINITY_DN81826_c0_g1_i1.p1  ORF type:complete len:110 (+),score=4.71 TRINITY_DN81826_c0_g1_i1:49-330(+)
MDFNPGSSLSSGSRGAGASDQQVMQDIQQQMGAMHLQEYMTSMRDKCFKVCIQKPSNKLQSSEQQCLSKCIDNYMQATEIVTNSLISMGGVGQ